MALHKIKKGLDVPLAGSAAGSVEDAPAPTHVAIVAADFIGMKPRMRVEEGDEVRRGQVLFEDRKQPGVLHTAPGAGKVVAINRGAKRALQSVVIALNERERAGSPGDEDFATFAAYTGKLISDLSRDAVVALLKESGLWTALRTRPFSRVPSPEDDAPHAVFINAMDTNPLAFDPAKGLEGREADLEAGASVVSKLTDGTTYFCRAGGSSLGNGLSGVQIEEFSGPHPAGLVGTHIHTLSPVSRQRSVWYLSAEDVAAIGALFRTGRVDVQRVVAVGGPQVQSPKLLRTRLGASIQDLTAGNLKDGDNRVISGSVLSGRTSMGDEHAFLGRYARQVSVLLEGRDREFIGWLLPGLNKFTINGSYLGGLLGWGKKTFNLTTNTNGSHRAMVPIGQYERVFPLDILPTFLLRAITVDDIERGEALGMLELDEEDLALCTVVCVGKWDYGPILRRNLDIIMTEG